MVYKNLLSVTDSFGYDLVEISGLWGSGFLNPEKKVF
jgi:hypothetical protein